LAEAGVLPRPAHPYPDDDRYPSGWFTWDECDLLADWARGKLILELGTFLGRSTVAMARTAKHVVTVDHFSGSPLENWYEPGDYLPQTRENLRRYGVERNVTVIAADTRSLLEFPILMGAEFDGALVDAAHDYASIQRDTTIALLGVKQGSELVRIVWDDYTPDWPDVQRYLEAFAARQRMTITPLAPGSKLVRLA
jgi:hypothetical protein